MSFGFLSKIKKRGEYENKKKTFMFCADGHCHIFYGLRRMKMTDKNVIRTEVFANKIGRISGRTIV